MELSPGNIIRHFKGGEYKIILTDIIHSETQEEMILYKSVDAHKLYVRPKSMFNEEVLYEGKIVKRFKIINGF